MKIKKLVVALIGIPIMFSCTSNQSKIKTAPAEEFKYVLEQFADLRILRYEVTGFDSLTLNQKKLVYYLSQAALCGRDIMWDQNGKYNLIIRKTLENIYTSYKGDRESDDFKKFVVYLKRIWFSNGIYHHYSNDKFEPGISQEYFVELVKNSNQEGFPTMDGKTLDETISQILPVLFDKNLLNKKVNLDSSLDLVKASAVNFYQGITQQEVEKYYKSLKKEDDQTPLSFGLNSRLVKENGTIGEITCKSGGLYGTAIDKIVFWLEKALPYAESPEQTKGIEKLVEYYKTGDLKLWDEYNILWVSDHSQVDFVNGFVEVYNDPLGIKGSWESIVNFKNIEATKRTEKLSTNAQWFEDNSPVDSRFKKKEVKGVSAKVITVATLAGDCYPATPIGINLPNADWIRKDYGSKSVTIENITNAYDQASKGTGFAEEFLFDSAEVLLVEKYKAQADNLHTDLHECLGHGSGQLLPGVSTEALKNYHSTLEETRADLFALYYMMDQKMLELGLLPSLDATKAQYIDYMLNGLMTQLKRVELGKNIEESHMRNRQLIAMWCYEHGKSENVIEKIIKENKTYFRINNFEKVHQLLGQLLAEVQRIKSEGDYQAGKDLVENFGVKVDYNLHKEVLERYAKLNLAPYSGFVNPEYELVEKDGEITDVKVKYVDDYATQMLKYSKEYSFLPVMN